MAQLTRQLRGLFFLWIFCVDVHVKADVFHDCWGKTTPCVVKAESGRRVLQLDDLHLVLGPGALVEQRTDKLVQLVSGDFYAEAEAPVQFQTPYGKIWCDGKCKGIFIRTEKEINIKSLFGSWTVQRAGEAKQPYAVNVGTQITLGEVTDLGAAQMDFPQSLPWTATITQWAALYPGKFKDFKPVLAKFRQEWKEATERLTEMQKGVATRVIASAEKEQAEELARIQAREREDQSLRQLFREKNP